MNEQIDDVKRLQGHWVLAKLGKRVLRPGGIELTRRLVAAAAPTASDRIVEFGPGTGRTAELLLQPGPASYRGVDPHRNVAPQLLGVLGGHPQAELIEASAAQTGLPDGDATLVLGEAMLTMQPEHTKRAIIGEAARLLTPGGRYAIHELSLTPDDCPDEVATEVSHALSRGIKVGARPLTAPAWAALVEEAGLVVEWTSTNPMRLLEPSRLIADEGLLGAARFVFNVARNPQARQRITTMRATFRAHADNLAAIALVARKPR
ncbi:MAG TPA: class I SAM-dependent methyltransferase [Arachnia sp.]|nr:class I SAM-dependent methyltransferase [Arachnia sp.]HMT84778.1 class I SAM-dependent methyltransferase [Arachnia sp.]